MNKIKKLSYLNIFRTMIQLVFFVLLPGLYASAFLGIKLIYQGIIEQNFSFTESFPQLISAISVIPLTIFFGRFFCGWMCAFGTLGDMLYYLSRNVFHIKFKIDEEADEVLKYVKYAVFVFIFIVVWSLQAFDISALSPWDAFGSLLTFTSFPNFSYVITELTVGLLLLCAIMVGSLFVERFFCRYLCPLGAIFAITSHLKIIRIKKPSKDCGPCKACTSKCSMGIPLYQMDSVASGECIDCMNCVSACPRNNVNVTIATAATNPALAGAMAVTAMSGIYYISTFATDASAAAIGTYPVSNAAAVENDSIYANGTYTGSGIGFHGATTTISVTIAGGVITNIEVISHGDDAPYFNSAFNSVVSQIISTQSSDVDAVSGATFSSDGIMDAVANALDKAMQALNSSSSDVASNDTTANTITPTERATITDVAPTTTPTGAIPSPTDAPKDTSSNATTDSESSSASDSSSSSDKKKKSASTKKPTSSSKSNTTSDNSTSNSEDSAATAKETTPTIAPSSSDNDASSSSSSTYKDGVYEGSANGFRRGITTVSVTVKDDTITDIQIVSNGDDAPYFNRASNSVVSDILDSQSTDVDAVSGATYSSMGIMNAVADALNSAEN